MDDDEYDFTAERQFLQNVHNVLAVAARQSTGGLVDKQHGRFSNQLQGDVQPLALTSGNGLIHYGPHAEISDVPKPQPTECQFNTFKTFFFRGTAQTQIRTEFEVFINGQFTDEYILLSDVAEAALGISLPPIDRATIEVNFTKRGFQGAIQNVQQRGLARSTRPHDANQVA